MNCIFPLFIAERINDLWIVQSISRYLLNEESKVFSTWQLVGELNQYSTSSQESFTNCAFSSDILVGVGQVQLRFLCGCPIVVYFT